MRLVIDACSVILLAKASMLEECTKWKEMIITNGVYAEVLKGKEKQLEDALLLERLVDEEKMKIESKTQKEVVQKLTQDFGLGVGEAESIAVAGETQEKIILTDNKQGRKAAKIYGLKLVGSIDVILALLKTEKISKEKAVHALKTLKDKGWFQNYVIEEAIAEVQNG